MRLELNAANRRSKATSLHATVGSGLECIATARAYCELRQSARVHCQLPKAYPTSYGVYLKLLMYMYRVGPMVAVPPQVDLFVPHALNKNGAEALGTAWV